MGFTVRLIVASAWLVVIMSSMPVVADTPRLFHQPVEMEDTNTPENTQDLTTALITKHKTVTAVPPIEPAPSVAVTVVNEYTYNGFITTGAVTHYLINGMPLINAKGLELLSVKLRGRRLVLKTLKGHVFELSVGQSITLERL